MSDDIHVSTSTTPIVTYSAENAFVFDTGATNTYTFTIMRKNPHVGEVVNGSTVTQVIEGDLSASTWTCTYEWSNASWKKAMTAFINRWQAKTNGCKMYYTPIVQIQSLGEKQDVFQRRIDGVNIYLKSISFEYTITSPEIIKTTLSVMLGSMCGPQRTEW